MQLLQRLHAVSVYGFPRPLLAPRTDVERLRSWSLQERYRHLSPAPRAAVFCLASLGYPFAAAAAALRSFHDLRARNANVQTSELVRMYAAALLRNIPPVEYALYGFHRAAARKLSGEYLYWMDTPALLRLNRLRAANNEDVQDKARFAGLCRAAGLPHVAMIAATCAGKQVEGTPLADLKERDLWVKPTHAHASQGSQGWTFDGVDTYHSGDEALPAEVWRSHLLVRDCIVQKRITNHPDLEPLTNGSAAVLRLTTVADRSGSAALIGAGVGLPYGSQRSTAGAVACSVDLESGQIDRAFLRGSEPVTTYPDTGRALNGAAIPCWRECVQLVLEAHRVAFSSFASLGWDVVVTPAGPLLLEANSGWNPIGLQFNFGPLGRSALAAIVAQELRERA